MFMDKICKQFIHNNVTHQNTEGRYAYYYTSVSFLDQRNSNTKFKFYNTEFLLSSVYRCHGVKSLLMADEKTIAPVVFFFHDTASPYFWERDDKFNAGKTDVKWIRFRNAHTYNFIMYTRNTHIITHSSRCATTRVNPSRRLSVIAAQTSVGYQRHDVSGLTYYYYIIFYYTK